MLVQWCIHRQNSAMKYTNKPLHTDISTTSWIDAVLPSMFIPYARMARLDRPIGIILLLLPCLWGLILGSGGIPNLTYFFLYCLGAILMRGAGCTYNDLVDADIDARVERTRVRPLPSGQLTKVQALLFLGIQLGLSFLILLQLPALTVALGCLSLILVFIYPWMKKITFWPQAFLGFTFNWGVLMGWSTATNRLTLTPLFLYLGGIFWTLIYDTLYAHQDKQDDLLAGVRSTALKFDQKTPYYLCVFSILCLGFWGLAGWQASLSWPYYGGLSLIFLHFLWQILTADLDNPQDCLYKFKSNQWIGWILLAGLGGALAL